jgi:tetratricopeptide (TPR) repeat protein/tRNA A-37 threonylcarbamoyl transferase component Bud32/DNA-directed RNA polymerase subunit RPC12/RpoP
MKTCFKFACSHCGQHIECETILSGQQIKCPACNQRLVIPAPEKGPTTDNREVVIFQAALKHPRGAEREGFLEGACLGDQALHARLAALLQAHEKPDSFFERQAVPPGGATFVLPPEEGPGTVIGRYKILEKIGEGGFGAVYVAEQREPVKRRVALKIIKLGMDTKQVVARFEVERQALALMDHPNIARVLDAGATDTGRPFFVMELIKGIPIMQYCDQEKLGTRERLGLFIQVCHAIQHAHQKGIIHRDIKPSNILVTLHDGVPVPKVIDFGIAKATQAELTEKTVYTQFQQFIGTPAYMSPEQAEMSGLDMDTRSDIYSLGVLLYELLTGTTPFDTKELLKSGVDEMRKIIRERQPVRPSTRQTQQLGSAAGSSIANRKSQIANDLDWIVLKCLEKDRTRRYETANGLAMDIERHLNNEPVAARPPSKAYRFQKLVRRNKLAFAVAGAVALSLVLGLGFSLYSGIRERKAAIQEKQARLKAEAAQKTALREVEKNRVALELDAFMYLNLFQLIPPNMATGIVAMLDDAAKILDRENVRSQPEIEAHLRMMFGFAYVFIGDNQKGETMYRKVLELSPRIGDANLAVAMVRADYAVRLSLRGEYAAAEKMATEVLASAKAIGATLPTLDALVVLAAARVRHGDFSGAERALREAQAIHRNSLVLLPASGSLIGKAQIYGFLLVILQGQGQQAEVEQLLRAAAKELTTDEYTAMLVWAVVVSGQFGLTWNVAIATLPKLIDREPENAWPYLRLGALLVQTGDLEGYRQHRAHVLAHFRETTDPNTAERLAKDCLIQPLSGAELDTAAKLADRAVTLGQTSPGMPAFQFAKGLAEYRQGRFSSAAEWMQRVLNVPGVFFPRDAQADMVLAMARHQLGQTNEALAALADGSQIIALKNSTFESGDAGLAWPDWIIARVLKTEAEGLLEVSQPEQAAKFKRYLAEASRKWQEH